MNGGIVRSVSRRLAPLPWTMMAHESACPAMYHAGIGPGGHAILTSWNARPCACSGSAQQPNGSSLARSPAPCSSPSGYRRGHLRLHANDAGTRKLLDLRPRKPEFAREHAGGVLAKEWRGLHLDF